MTTATTRSRTRKARATAQALMPRGQHLIDQGADMLILSARMAETPVPVFWAKGELDARTTLAVHADAGWDDNYERAGVGGGYHWDWYRAAMIADGMGDIPVAVIEPSREPWAAGPVTAAAGVYATLTADTRFYRLNSATGELDPAPLDGDGEAHMAAFLAAPDVPGPDGALLPPSAPEIRTEDPPIGAAGPGTPEGTR